MQRVWHILAEMTVAKPEISWVLDITIAYPQGKPLDLPTIITGSRPPCETVLFYRLFPSTVVSDSTCALKTVRSRNTQIICRVFVCATPLARHKFKISEIPQCVDK